MKDIGLSDIKLSQVHVIKEPIKDGDTRTVGWVRQQIEGLSDDCIVSFHVDGMTGLLNMVIEDDASDEALESLVRNNQLVEAIKRCRRKTACGLVEAKLYCLDLVKDSDRRSALSVVHSWSPPSRERFYKNLSDPQLRVHAVKQYRDITGSSLKECVDACNALQDSRRRKGDD